jgi:hypothetical protein
MSDEMRPVDIETYQRRRALFVAASTSSLGVLALTLRQSSPHPGRTSSLVLIAIGILVYVAPFAFIVDRAMRRGATRMAAVAVVGVGGGLFLATRSVGSFSQVWPVFTMIVTVIALQVIGQLMRAGLIPALATGDSR